MKMILRLLLWLLLALSFQPNKGMTNVMAWTTKTSFLFATSRRIQSLRLSPLKITSTLTPTPIVTTTSLLTKRKNRFYNHKNDEKESSRKRRRGINLRKLVVVMIPLFLVPLSAFASATTTYALPNTYIISPSISPTMELQLCSRILVAALLGAALGKERSFAKHSAGVRTMALVAMGASAFTVCSAYGFTAQLGGRFDPSRMASSVASGVGFVGAGVITTTHLSESRNMVHGLTTAATIWLSAAVGVACGTGLQRIATTTALATIIVLRMGRKKTNSLVQSSSSTKNSSTNSVFNQQEEENEDDYEDCDDETHDTSAWDEHPETILPINNNNNHQQDDNNNHLKVELEEDSELQEIIFSTNTSWKNSSGTSLLQVEEEDDDNFQEETTHIRETAPATRSVDSRANYKP